MTLLGHAGLAGRVVTLSTGSAALSGREVSAVPDCLDLRVHDRVALDEIELYAEVLSAVAASDHPLTPEEIDEVLGVKTVA